MGVAVVASLAALGMQYGISRTNKHPNALIGSERLAGGHIQKKIDRVIQGAENKLSELNIKLGTANKTSVRAKQSDAEA